MGKFFNTVIRNMPSSEVKKLRKDTKVTINPIYGQTKGFLEEMRKDFNEPVDEERQKMLDRMAKMREAKKK